MRGVAAYLYVIVVILNFIAVTINGAGKGLSGPRKHGRHVILWGSDTTVKFVLEARTPL